MRLRRAATLNDLDVDVSWFGTGMRRIPGCKPHDARERAAAHPLDDAARPAPRATIVEAEDDGERHRGAPREAEEAALEADEDDE